MTGPRIYITEAIPGGGKDTVMDRLERELDELARVVYSFPEEATLFSWKHHLLPNIAGSRITLMEAIVAAMAETLAREPDTVFLINRFHISYALATSDSTFAPRYEQLLESLRDLDRAFGVLVIVPVLDRHEMSRARHPERRGRAWRDFLAARQAASAYGSIEALYAAQQERIIALVQQQGLPYRLVHVAIPSALTTVRA